MTNAEARCNKSLRPRKPEGSLGRTAQDVHLDSHTAPELCQCYRELNSDIHYQTSPLHRCPVLHHSDEKPDPSMGVSCPRLEEEASWPSCPQRTWHVYQLTLSGRLMANGRQLELARRLQLGESQVPSDIISTSTPDVDVKVAAVEFSWSRFSSC